MPISANKPLRVPAVFYRSAGAVRRAPGGRHRRLRVQTPGAGHDNGADDGLPGRVQRQPGSQGRLGRSADAGIAQIRVHIVHWKCNMGWIGEGESSIVEWFGPIRLKVVNCYLKLLISCYF